MSPRDETRSAASCPWCKHGEHLDAACACGCPPLSRVSLTNDRPAAPVQHPHYLDDEGGGSRCFLLHHLAANRGEAEKIVEHMGFEWDWRTAESDAVWMVPVDSTWPPDPETRYEPVAEYVDGAARYWRWRW